MGDAFGVFGPIWAGSIVDRGSARVQSERH